MNFSHHTRILLAVTSGIALALSFPKYNLPLLAWIAIGMLVLASCGARPAESLIYGFLHGLVFIPISVPWIDAVMQEYGNIDAWTSAGILGLLAVRDGIIFSVFSLGVALAYRRSRELACVLAPFLWVALEFFDARVPIFSFPWNLAGYAVSGNLALVQLTTLTGVYGLSFVIAGYGSLTAYAVMVRTRRAWTAVTVVTAVLVLLAVGGGYFVPAAPASHTAHLIQTNFPQSESYPSNWMQIHAAELDELDRISVAAAKQSPGVIIWPEVPAPFSLQDAAFQARATRIATDSGEDFLVGVVDWKMEAGKWEASNAAVLLDPTGRRIFTYDKIHLVPFGEYVPLRHLLSFAGRLTADISDFTPGTVSSVGKLPGGSFGVFICYEAVFAGEVRQFAADGAELLITISNDGWFGHSAARAQHLMMARVRAVESRRWLLRDTNNGYTASIDPYGRIVARMAPDVRGELDAPYDFRTGLTPYARFGDWFAWLCVFVSLALFLLPIASKPR
jgi:apolipoprotein N-acyltransferase